MKTIYETKEYKGYGKQNYYWNEYRLDEDNDTIIKTKCHRQKFFNGDENEWSYDEKNIDSWSTSDNSKPSWLNNFL